jgi:hypothetical protein
MPGNTDLSTNRKFFIWPDEDTAYMKLIWRYPSKKYPSGFHVLGSRYHPVGDFDRPDVLLPRESLRIYETRNGFRVFFTGRFNTNLDSMFDELDQLGGDPLYSKYARQRRYYACRVDPKTNPAPDPWSVCRLVEQVGEPLPEWREFIEFHDAQTNALAEGTFLV